MRCEFLFVMKVRVLKVCDERGEGREVHGNATNGRKDSGVFVGGNCPIGKDSGGVCTGAEALEQKFRTAPPYRCTHTHACTPLPPHPPRQPLCTAFVSWSSLSCLFFLLFVFRLQGRPPSRSCAMDTKLYYLNGRAVDFFSIEKVFFQHQGLFQHPKGVFSAPGVFSASTVFYQHLRCFSSTGKRVFLQHQKGVF